MSTDNDSFIFGTSIPGYKEKTTVGSNSPSAGTPNTEDPKPKRKYTRREQVKTEEREDPAKASPGPTTEEITDEALQAAEGLFEDAYLLGYHTICSFVKLYHMVKPEDRKEMAKILEGIVK